MTQSDKPDGPKHGLPPDKEPPPLPKWFALRGPAPFWFVQNLPLIMSLISGTALILNGLLTSKLLPGNLYNEVTTGVAWLSTAGLFVQSRQAKWNKIAEWREKVRNEEKDKNDAD
jgi:hypothetical protein